MTTAELTIELGPDDGLHANGFLRAEASVTCGSFSGRTAFLIARRDLDAFASDVGTMQRGDADAAQLLGGWDSGSERLRLRIARAGTTESFTVRVLIANLGMRNDQWHRVETQFVSEGSRLEEFARALAAAPGSGGATLAGDADSIA